MRGFTAWFAGGRGRSIRRVGCSVAALAGIGAAAGDAKVAWRQGSQLFFNEAAQSFAADAAGGARGREARLGRAVMLLGVQPKTTANLDEARQLFSALHRENPGDEHGIAAQYYAARWEQLHAERPSAARACDLYRELVRKHSDHYFGQLARVKLVLLTLYDAERPAGLGERLPEAEAWGAGLTDPVLRCDFHYIMSRALARLDGREPDRLAHLLAMEATGRVIRDPTRTLMLIEIGELARGLGQREVATRAYRQFVTEYPRDPRQPAVRTRLAALEGRP